MTEPIQHRRARDAYQRHLDRLVCAAQEFQGGGINEEEFFRRVSASKARLGAASKPRLNELK